MTVRSLGQCDDALDIGAALQHRHGILSRRHDREGSRHPSGEGEVAEGGLEGDATEGGGLKVTVHISRTGAQQGVR